jgi:hypothetical protein
MAYTSTQRFVKFGSFLLMEYDYTTAPTPEIYYVNTGLPAIGFEKIVNGYFNNAVQILNNPAAEATTGNVRDLSVVQTDRNRFVTLDQDYLVPYLDTDPKLTSVNNLPVVFPSNIGVYYDTIKFHIVAGYNFENIDGIILQGQFQERTGKKATIFQRLITKSDTTSVILNPNPIYLGGVLYDHYIEIKIPAYANMVYEFDILAGTPAQASTLAAKISSDGNGFLKDAPITINLYEITSTALKNGYENYIAQSRNQLSVVPKDNFSSLAAVIQENSFYNYLEFYPTWDGNFLEDFLNAEGKVGNIYYVINEIEVKEQVGLSYITTYNFTSSQTQDFNAPSIFRPILINPLTTSFLVNYTMRLVNKANQNQIIRKSTFSSFDVSKYGKENNIISLTTGAYSQKVYNKIIQAPNVISGGPSIAPPTPIEKRIPVFYKDNNISITKETLIVDKDGNLISETSIPDATQIFGQGKAKIVMDPFDNFFKFTVYNYKQGSSPEILDLGTSLSYYIVFIDPSGQSVKVENIKNRTTVSNPSAGQVAFKVVETNSKKVLGFTSRDFYIVSRTPDGTETKLYSGSWQTQAEFIASTTTPTTTTTTPTTTGVTGTTPDTTTGVSVTGATASSIPTTSQGSQITSKVPVSKLIKKPLIYNLGSSSILSVKPTSMLNTTGGFVNTSKKNATAPPTNNSSNQANNINIDALADSIAGREAQGLNVQKVVNYYFTPGAPGNSLFKGLTGSKFLIAALQIHPKLPNGTFDSKYKQYCNALGFPVTDDPGSIKK